MKDENGKFLGFYSPRYTQVPDELFDELLADLSGSELKVLMYVVRRTFGFKRDSDHISLSQMVGGITKKDGTVLDKGTGLSKESVSKAAKSLVEKGILYRKRKRSPEKGYETTEYTLNVTDSPLSENLTRGSCQEIGQGLANKSDTQETVLQKTDITLSKPVENSEALQQKELLGKILVVCRDLDSLPYYRQVVRSVPREAIFTALSQVREAKALGNIRKSEGAMFTDLIRRSQSIGNSGMVTVRGSDKTHVSQEL